jgi:tRNA threonylcarbamoyladenosine biosynthesis protein TsaB
MKKSYKRLVIDTATKYIYLALIIDDLLVDSVYEVGNNDHSVTIMPYLESMIKKQDISLNQLDEVIVGVGPGSYTGVRIGVTVAKMIAYLNDISIYKVSSLALMASRSNSRYILPLIDARRGNAFMALLENDKEMKYVKEDRLQNIDSFKNSINVEYEEVIEGEPQIIKIIKSNLLEPVEDVHALVPNYMQLTEAERNLKND